MGLTPSSSCANDDYNSSITLYPTSNKNFNHKHYKNQNNHQGSFHALCGTNSSHETIRNNEKSEVILATTYTYPKGTYTNESIRLFSENERIMFKIISLNNIPALRYWIIKGININIVDEDRTTPWHIACTSGNIQMVEEIINQGAMINIPDMVGWTPWHIASFRNRQDVVLLLLKHNANYKTKNRDKLTALDWARRNKCTKCAEIIENFIKNEKTTMEKCMKDWNSKLEWYDDVIKKFMTYQKLKCEYLDVHEEEELNNYMKSEYGVSEENKEIDDLYNTEMEKDIYKIYKEMVGNSKTTDDKKINDVNKSNVWNTHKDILSKYRYIPRKHKFYLNYEVKNNQIEYKSKNCAKNKSSDDWDLIQQPISFPLTTSISNLNCKSKKRHEGKPGQNIPETRYSNNLEEGDNEKDENTNDIYSVYSSSKDNSDLSQDSINLQDPLQQLNEINKENDESCNTIEIENDHNRLDLVFTYINENDELIFKTSYPRITTNSPQNVWISFFKANQFVYEHVLYSIFKYNYFSALELLITVNKIPNSITSWLSNITTNLFSKKWRALIWTKNKTSLEEKFTSKWIHILFNSMRSTNSQSNDNSHYFECWEQTFKYFHLNKGEILMISKWSKEFSSVFYSHQKESCLNEISSQSAMFYFTFSFLITQCNYRDCKTKDEEEKTICDFVIMIKNLNEGDNYSSDWLHKAINYIISNRNDSWNIQEEIESDTWINVGWFLEGNYKSYCGYYREGLFLWFEDKKCETWVMIIYSKIKEYYWFEVKNAKMRFLPKKREDVEGNGIVVIANKNEGISFWYYQEMVILVESKEIIDDIKAAYG